MKTTIAILVAMTVSWSAMGQDHPADSSTWELSADANFYFFTDQFIFVPMVKADKGKLHLETRYNYEDQRTFSGWAGYNFNGGKKIEYTITPMIGGVIGNSNGIAPGLEFSIRKNKWELYAEMEVLFELEKSNSFYYAWTDLTYSFNDWFWAGLSAQRTKLYQTNLDLQRGVLVGAAWKKFEITTYAYNMGFDTAFILVTLTANF